MPSWYYFARPTKYAFHNLTTRLQPPKNLRSLLGLGLKFIPTPSYTKNWSTMRDTSLSRLDRSLRLQAYFASSVANADDDASDSDDDEYNPKMYIRSSWMPPPWTFPPQLPHRLERFDASMNQLFKKKKGKPNLLPHQRRALTFLQTTDDFVVAHCDKNLGPAVIEKAEYVQMAFRDHLNDTATYRPVKTENISAEYNRLVSTVDAWIKKHYKVLSKADRKYLKKHRQLCKPNAFPAFYLTMKVHKKPLKSRPIVSCSGSLLEGLGQWVNSKLQPIAKAQHSYFTSSAELLPQLLAMQLPTTARLFTADAVSMYTNIPTSIALTQIRQYLSRHARSFPDIPIDALIEGLKIVMTNNIFSFGDSYWKQKTGTAMGTPPAPPYATLYYAILENTFVNKFPNLLFYRRYIDDVIGIWDDTDPPSDNLSWPAFKSVMNSPEFKLEWEHTSLSTSVDFMDLTITINADCKLSVTLYNKPSNMHLYIPPHSAHPPGLLSGIIFGGLHRIFTLCTSVQDQHQRTREFYQRLKARGHKQESIVPIFHSALARLQNKRITAPDTTDTTASDKKLFFHLQYHPRNPPSADIQQAWRDCIAEPPGETPLHAITTRSGNTLGKRRFVVAYSRPFNIGNHLSYRNLNGPPVSSYQITD